MLAAAALAGGANLAGSLINYFGGKENQASSQAFNEKMWRMNNEYNSPVNQMARFKEAGLNPNLIYGQGNAGNSSHAVSTNPAPAPNVDLGNAVSNYYNFKQIAQNIKNQEATEDLIRAQTKVLLRDSDINTELKKSQLNLNNQTYETNTSNTSNSGPVTYKPSDNFFYRLGGRIINSAASGITHIADNFIGNRADRLRELKVRGSGRIHDDYIGYLRRKNPYILPGKFYKG